MDNPLPHLLPLTHSNAIYVKIYNFSLLYFHFLFVVCYPIKSDLAGKLQLAKNKDSGPLLISTASLSSFRQPFLNPLCLLIALQDKVPREILAN